MRHRYPSATVPARGEVSIAAVTDAEFDVIGPGGVIVSRVAIPSGLVFSAKRGLVRRSRGRIAVWWPGMWWGQRP